MESPHAASLAYLSPLCQPNCLCFFPVFMRFSCFLFDKKPKIDKIYTREGSEREEGERVALTESHEFELTADSMDAFVSLFGINDQNIALIEQECHVRLSLHDHRLVISGEKDQIDLAHETVSVLLRMVEKRETIDRVKIRYVLSMLRDNQGEALLSQMDRVIAVTHRGKQIVCKTLGQQEYVDTIRKHTLTFAVGVAGVGKTYLAMAMAVMALKNKEVERIILTRPAVEAGEKLGFLPGDLAQKVDPYLRPLYDAMYEFMGPDSYAKLMERGIVEVAPLAYMRGRTLSNAFIIMDEAQNTTSEQMKMFLTRIGFHSKVVVTGDITQTDLPAGKKSGLSEAVRLLRGIDDIGISFLTKRDVVRHELVQRIVEAYESAETEGK